MRRNLIAIADKAKNGPFTLGQVRWWVFNEHNNGLAAADAVVRIGRRVYLDEDRFDDWIESQAHRQTPQAA